MLLNLSHIFVTNRTANLEEATKNNLEDLGFVFIENRDQLLMKGEIIGSNKKILESLDC